MTQDVDVNRRTASMRAGLLSVVVLVGVCFALAFLLADSKLEATSPQNDDVVSVGGTVSGAVAGSVADAPAPSMAAGQDTALAE